ncbi:hypothetical protein ACHQM5_023271 [Ranunculus cassubicifolius]
MKMENSPSQRRVLDRLSSLPPELINVILKRVSIRDVVRTSALSRFWRCRWMLIPDLVFDPRSFPRQTITKPVDFINIVLLLHNGNVSQFEIKNVLDRYYPDVDRWLHLLARKLVKVLILQFPAGNVRCKLSSALFSCRNLRLLKLQWCILNIPSYAKGFSCLVDLHLRNVSFTEETIACLIVNCPLTRLILLACDGFTRLNIYAPNLQIFSFHGPCESINFGNTPKLAYASIGMLPFAGQIPVTRHNGRRLSLQDLLGGLVNVKELHILKHFMKILVACNIVPGNLHVAFSRLKSFSLELNFDEQSEILTAIKLCRSAPCLQLLTITNCSNRQLIHLNEGDSLQTRLQLGEYIFPHLVTVQLIGFKGGEYEMSFLQCILSNALVLEALSIQWDITCVPNDQRRARVLESMLQFERVSPIAKVVFLN